MILRLLNDAYDRVMTNTAGCLDVLRRLSSSSAPPSKWQIPPRRTRGQADLAIGQYLADLWNL
jgi:hypothetical protein